MATRIDDLYITGDLTCPEDAISPQLRSSILKQTQNAVFPIPLADLRVWDAYGTNLPATAATDDLGLIGGTFGTAPPMIQAGDLKAAGATTRYARVQVIVPECYDAAETLSIVISAGMKTTVADVSCTVDVEAYRVDKISGISADLCATAAQSINSLTFANKTFTITAATFSAGDVIDMRIAIACNDAATATAVTPTIAGLDLVCDIKG
jgi:hydrogenase maturation factor